MFPQPAYSAARIGLDWARSRSHGLVPAACTDADRLLPCGRSSDMPWPTGRRMTPSNQSVDDEATNAFVIGLSRR